MNLKVLAFALSLIAVAACTKEKEVRVCNANTLLLNFTCGDDLAEVNGLEFRLTRKDGLEGTFKTSLTCPGARAYEVDVKDYAEAQEFKITATATKDGAPFSAVNELAQFPLATGCTSITFPLSAKGGTITPIQTDGPVLEAKDAGDDTDNNETGVIIPVDRGSKENGLTCTEGAECMNGFCSDGVCCDRSCKGTCEGCNLAGSMGQCKPTPNGKPPTGVKSCETNDVATCGLDGMCNGEGECRKWPDGSVCAPGQCEGAGTRGRKTCKTGTCTGSNDLVCAPFACDAKSVSCFNTCDDSTMCESGKACAVDADTKKKSCGKKPLGAVCVAAPECESGNCADGVCCSTACGGACRSCNLVGSVGECKNVGTGGDDPHSVCKAANPTTCGQTGKCDGSGGCSLFTKGAVCSPAKCAGNDGVPASECDGNGSCVAGRPVACAPFTCGSNACNTKCTTDAECTGGTSCVNGSCGLLPKGTNCNTASQCASNFCVDGVCCDTSCNGTCQFCATAAAKGTCTDIAAGADDPRSVCKATATSTCGNNGKCNGQKGCQKWAQGIECVARSCDVAANKESYAKQCDGAGTCAEVKTAADCAPFTCGGNACGTTCSRDDQCVAPNTCVNGLCGKRRDGQPCSSAAQCLSNVCAQGVCCAGACSGTCKSCAVPGKEGSCENVGAGQDPLNQCDALASTTCKTTGSCDGTGKCAVHASGVICDGAKCSADVSQEIGSSTCDGSGNCKAPAAITCSGNLICSSASCKGSCSIDADCRGGTKCNSRTKQCGKPDGQTCGGNGDCGSDKCADGFCCNSACGGACESCSGAATGAANGVCSPIPNGTNDGSCPGASCANNAATPGSTCNGARACTTPGSMSCGEFSCSGGSCLSSCSAGSPCSDPNKQCVNGQCKKNQGVGCGSPGECASGFCIDGVCCNVGCNGACQTCGSGTCTPVTSGGDPLCIASTCGLTGLCGPSGCQAVAVGTSCGSPSCVNANTQAVATPTCAGGSCNVPSPTSCAPGTCKGTACSDSCVSDGECASGNYCNGSSKCVAKVGAGAACPSASACLAGLTCVAGPSGNICCNTTCNGGASSCQTGLCNSNGLGCQPAVSGSSCGVTPSCSNSNEQQGQWGSVTLTTYACDGAGATSASCKSKTSNCCGGTANCRTCRDAATCVSSCAYDTDCQAGFYCSGGSCNARKNNGAACTRDLECVSRTCWNNGGNGQCVECVDDSDCSDVRKPSCNGNTHLCQACVPYLDGCNNDNSTNCIPQQIFDFNAPVLGAQCDNSTHHWYCVAQSLCPVGTACTYRGGSFLCASVGRAPCLQDSACVSGVCGSDHLCTPVTAGTGWANSCRSTNGQYRFGPLDCPAGKCYTAGSNPPVCNP